MYSQYRGSLRSPDVIMISSIAASAIYAIPYALICLSNIVHDQLKTEGGNKKTKKKLYKRKYKRNLTIIRKRKLRSIK